MISDALLDLPEQQKRLEMLLKNIKHHPYSHESKKLPDHVTIKEKDKPILLAAIAAKADYLITGDIKYFGKFYRKNIDGVIILPPSEYLNKTHQK